MNGRKIIFVALGLACAGVVAAAYLFPHLFLESQKSTADCIWCTGTGNSMGHIQRAEEKHHEAEGRYAYDLKLLAEDPNLGAESISKYFATGLKEGYRYGRLPDFNAMGESDPIKGFAYYAVPETYGVTGRLTYIQSQSKILYTKDTGGNTPPSSWPSPSPEALGWTPHPE
jgi:hypothetical protein